MLTSSLLGSVTLSLVIATIRGVLPALFVTSQSWREGVSKGREGKQTKQNFILSAHLKFLKAWRKLIIGGFHSWISD